MSLESKVTHGFEDLARRVAPAPDAWARVQARMRRRYRRRVATRAVLVVAIGVAAALIVPRVWPEPPAEMLPADQTADWKTYRDPGLGLSFRYPPAWHFQTFSEPSRINLRGAYVTNVGRDLKHPAIPDGYTSTWDFRGLPADVVVVQVQH